MAVDVDNIQLKLAARYRFQIFAFVCLGLLYSRGSLNTFGVLFLAANAGQSCDDDTTTTTTESRTPVLQDNGQVNFSVTSDKKSHRQFSLLSTKHCETQAENGTNITDSCPPRWIYHSQYESTIVSEWRLVCVRAYLAELSTSIYMVGSMAGAMLITPFSDKFGRRPVLLICLFIQAAFGSAVAWAPNYKFFTFLRFLVGFFNMGISLCSFVMMVEILPAKYRTVPGLGFQIFWAVGLMMTALFGYLIQNWRYLQLAISLPNILCIIIVWFLPESLPWLISQNKFSKAQKVIETIAHFNGINAPNDLFVYETTHIVRQSHHEDRENGVAIEGTSAEEYVTDEPFLSGSDEPAEEMHLLSMKSRNENPEPDTIDNDIPESGSFQNSIPTSGQRSSAIEQRNTPTRPAEPKKLKNVLSLCGSSRIRTYSFIMFYLFFVSSLSYFGISLSIPILHGNAYFNLFLLGAVEIPTHIICIVICVRCGRKSPLLMVLLVCGFMNVVAMLISEQASTGMSVTRVVLVWAGKVAITGGYSIIYLYAIEIFPTAIRCHAIGVSSFFENMGSMAAPLVIYFAKSHQELPVVLFGVLSVVGGVTTFALPETQLSPLPQTVTDTESLGMLKRRRIV